MGKKILQQLFATYVSCPQLKKVDKIKKNVLFEISACLCQSIINIRFIVGKYIDVRQDIENYP